MLHFEFNRNDPACIQRALNTEWLLTNGLGGYAMGTVLDVNTRRYHGLLVAATKPPVGRVVALHSMIEQLVLPKDDGSEEVIDLSTQQFVGANGEPILHPDGWRGLTSYDFLDGGVQWTCRVPSTVEVTRLIHLNRDCNQLHLHYVIQDLSLAVTLRLRPFVPLRDFHALASTAGRVQADATQCGCQIDLGAVTMSMKATTSELTAPRVWRNDAQWWNHFAYQQDRERSQDWVENVWSPGLFEFRLKARDLQTIDIVADVSPPTGRPPGKSPKRTNAASTQFADSLSAPDRLTSSANAFVVTRLIGNTKSTSVIAGYPWFGDWGRDTMISLPGLMLGTKRFDEALSCLMMFATNIKNGLIPNVFDDYGGAAHYNTVDAPLWFIHAVREYFKATQSAPSLEGRVVLLNACREIIAAYRRGTDFDIRMDPSDSLISAGDESSQLTWMDAKRDGVCFTPRHGKAVEINALWHNALLCMAEMTDDLKECEELTSLSRHVAESFRGAFWWVDKQCLHDVLLSVRRDEASVGRRFSSDGHLRPNQIFAVSLPFSPLNEAQQRAVVKIVGERLLTPYGLRTLDRSDPGYCGRYEGSLFERDRAYHNGTVWPWLIGPYCEALLRVEKFSDAVKQSVREILQPLLNELDVPNGGCVNQLAEVYDGDEPQRPSGCPAQAWSVAEVLRILTLVS